MAELAEPRPEPPVSRFPWVGTVVVLSVLAVVSALFITAVNRATEVANRSRCGGNLLLLHCSMRVYVSAFGGNKDYMPHAGDAFFTCLIGHAGPEHHAVYSTKAPLAGSPYPYVCPNSGSGCESVTPGGSMADYLGPRRHPLVPAGNPSALVDGIPPDSPIGCDRPGNHNGGGNVLRFDGMIQFREGEEYEAAVKACTD